MLIAQWDMQYPFLHVCDVGEHVMTLSLSLMMHAHVLYHTCIVTGF